MKPRIFSIIATFVGVLFFTQAWAAPAITSVNGTISNNQSVTISGSGFGTKAQAAPVLWDTVDNQPAYSSLADGATIPTGPGYPWTSAAYGNSSGNNYVKMSITDSQRGVSKKQYKVTNQTTGYLDGLTWPATNQVYVSWWWKQTANYNGTTYSAKWLRLSNAANEQSETFSWEQGSNYVFSNPNYCQVGGGEEWDSWNGNPNNWNFVEVWVDSAARTYTVRINGVPLSSNVSWSNCASFQFNELWKIGMDCGGTSPVPTTWWMDDIYVDSTFSRVMACNASTYAASTHCEMQIPSAWSASSITATFNQGSFASGATAYLYVLDSSGNVNSSGLQITIGGSSSSPPVPTGLHLDE